MDNIDRILRDADKAGFGVSYGKYRAAHPQVSVKKEDSAKDKDSTKICAECGMEFKTNRQDKIYCSAECSNRSCSRACYRNRKEKQKLPIGVATCPICGGSFNRYKKTMVYCSRSCSATGSMRKRWEQKRETSSDG